MAIKKQLVADSGVVSQGAATVNGALTITGATTANSVSATSATVTNGIAANTVTANNVNSANVAATVDISSPKLTVTGGWSVNSTAASLPPITSTRGNLTNVNATHVTSTTANTTGAFTVGGLLTVGGNTAITGNVTIGGTLTVSGGVTTINTTQVNIADNILTLNSDFTAGSPTENAGFEVLRGASATVGVRWNETTDVWEASDGSGSYAQLRRVGTDIALGSETSGNYVESVTGSSNGLAASGSGEGAAVTLTMARANTTTVGTTQLIDSVASSNTTTAATPNSVKTAYDAAISANTLAAGKVSSVSGTTGRITSSGGTTPAIDLATVVTAGSNHTKVSYDAYGRITAGSAATTTDIAEGTNLYHTTARARGVLVSGTGISYDSPSGTITNSDRGSSQLFFKSIANSSGVVQFAATVNQDTIRFSPGSGISVSFDNVNKAVTIGNDGVQSFNTRTGAVTLTNADVEGAVGSLVNSFNTRTGAVTLTSADVTNALGYTPAAEGGSGVSSFNTRTGAVTLTSGDVTGALGFTPATTTQASNASYLSSGTVASARISGAYTGITSVGSLSSLDVNGQVDGDNFFCTATGGGTAAAPGYTFSVDSDIGMFRKTTNTLGWTTAGVERMSLSTSTLAVNGAITSTGTMTASSDLRLKKDIVDITPGEGLNVVMALEPVRFTRIADDTTSSGYIAQQFRTVAPEQVVEDEEGMLSIDVIGASPYHTAAIQYLASRVQYLEERLARLEGK